MRFYERLKRRGLVPVAFLILGMLPEPTAAPIPDHKLTLSADEAKEESVERVSTELEYADRISYCESGQTNDVSPDESSASGYFQFINSTWEWVTGLDAPAKNYSYAVQLEAFLTLWDEGRGASHWEPSRYCWEYEEPWEHFIRP